MSARALPRTRQAGLTASARRRLLRQTGIAYLYLAPAIVLLTLFKFFPAFFAFYISLFQWGLVPERFVGLRNYQRLLINEDFWRSLGTTVWYVLLAIPAEMVLGLALAYLLFQPIRGRALYRTAFFLPYITSTVAAALVWRWIYNPRRGLLNSFLEALNLPTGQWLQESTGVFELLFARFGVALPDALGAFNHIFVMTGGGPLESTRTVMLLVYRTFYEQTRVGYGSAMAFVLTGFILALTLLNFSFIGRRVHYD